MPSNHNRLEMNKYIRYRGSVIQDDRILLFMHRQLLPIDKEK
jgi:hypothetical protein